jgi:hypothetical protein
MAQRKIGDLVGLNIRIRIPILAGLVIIMGILCIAYIEFPANHDATNFVSLALTAVAGIGAAFYLGEGLRAQVEQQRQIEAFALIARWNSPDLFYARGVCHEALSAFQKDGKKGIDLYLADENKAENARHVLNFLEELAIAKRASHVDEQILERAFAGLVIRAFKAFEPWIDQHRRTIGRQKIWNELEALYKDWEGH